MQTIYVRGVSVTSKRIKKNCEFCEKVFLAEVKEINRGYGRFCGRSCASRFRGAAHKPKPNVECAQCGNAIYRNNSKKKNSKSGLYFCDRDCKNRAQRIGGIREIMPSHYGTTGNYVSICFRHHKKECIICSEKLVVAVHHYDENHNNNDPANLIPLCPTHHIYMHSRHKSLISEKVACYIDTWTKGG